MMNATLVLAPPARELDAGLKVSHGCVLDADQLRVALVVPPLVIMTDCDEVDVLPCTAEKVRAEVGTERTAEKPQFTLLPESLIFNPATEIGVELALFES